MRCLDRGASRWRAFLGAVVAAFTVWTLGFAAPVRAESEAPFDLLQETDQALRIPQPPKDFLERQVGSVVLRYAAQTAHLVDDLAARLPGSLRSVTSALGISDRQPIEIRIARGPDEMSRLAPASSPPPPYAVGVAYPGLGLVILSVVDPLSWLPPNMGQVLQHELSHIALHRAVNGRPLPLWFMEGLAVHQAGEQRLSRVQTLWEAALVDDVLPIDALSAQFPSRPNQVNLAYAESADLVGHLLHDERSRARLPALLSEVRRGADFNQALLSAFHIDLPYLEREWRRSLGERYRVLPMVLTGTALWGGIAILAVVAFIQRRRHQQQELSRWAEQEALEDRMRTELPVLPVNTAPVAHEPELYVFASPARDSAIPTIEHEGQRHTLH